MVSYIFGGEGLPKTPQELARLRAVAQAMAPSKAPQNVGEGLSSIGNAIAYRMMMSKAAKGEAMGQNTANSAFSALMSGMGGGTPPASSSVSSSTPAPSMAATPSNQPPIPGIQAQPQAGGADYIRQGLVKRGLPEHVADAFVVNFQDESGLNPGINEANPIVPGSRGGYGLYQLTGPRRVAYEAFAKERGVSPDNVDAQLDFLMMEGQGSEKAAFDKILSAPDKATAAQTIVKDFLRPSPEYRDSRMAKYASLASPQAGGSVDAVNAMGQGGQMPMPEASAYVDPMVSAPNRRAPVAQALAKTQPQQPMQPVEVAGGGGRQGIMAALMGGQQQTQDMPTDYFPAAPSAPGATSPSRQQIMQVLTNQFATPEQKAIATDMYQQMQQSQDPMRQLEMQKMQLELQQMQNPQVDPLKVGQGETIVDPRTGKVLFQADPKPEAKPSAVQEYEYAKEQGFPGTFQDWEASKKGGMSLQVDPATGAVTFQQGNNMKPMTEGQSKDAVYSTRAEGALPLIDSFGDSLTGLEGTVGGTVGQIPVVGNFAKSEGYQKAEQAGQEFLQAILRKDTGAAITSDEMGSYGTVYLPRPGDTPELLEQKKVSRRRALEAIKAGMPPQAILAQEKALAATATATEVPMPAGVDKELWDVMTPEERALWK